MSKSEAFHPCRRGVLKLLLVEDDAQLGPMMAKALRAEGVASDLASTADEAAALIAGADYGVILLDLGLPRVSGLSFLRTLRRGGDSTPVIIITAHDRIEDRISGLDAGADDYLIKPVDIAELMARVRAQIRRSERRSTETLVCRDVVLDLQGGTVEQGDRRIALTAKEFAIVALLMRRAGRYASRLEIEEAVYGDDREVSANALEATVASIRKKLGKTFILTTRGLGYMVAR